MGKRLGTQQWWLILLYSTPSPGCQVTLSSTCKFIKIIANITFQVTNQLPTREHPRCREGPTLFGTGEEVPVQQPLQEHSITMKMLQELKSHQLAGREHREACPWTMGSDGVEMQKATFWC